MNKQSPPVKEDSYEDLSNSNVTIGKANYYRKIFTRIFLVFLPIVF